MYTYTQTKYIRKEVPSKFKNYTATHTKISLRYTHTHRRKITVSETQNHSNAHTNTHTQTQTHNQRQKHIKYQRGVKQTKVNTLKEKERMTSI